MDQAARRPPFFFVQFAAIVTGAIRIITVILTDADHFLVGMGLKQGVNALRNNFQHLRISQAPLAGFAGMTFPFEIRVVFGMGLSIDGRRQQLVEGMYPITGRKDFRRLFQAVPPFIDRICTHGITLALPVTESRIVVQGDSRQRDGT